MVIIIVIVITLTNNISSNTDIINLFYYCYD